MASAKVTSTFLLIESIIILILSTVFVYLSLTWIMFLLVDKFGFVSPFYEIIPYAILALGVASAITAILGCTIIESRHATFHIVYAILLIVCLGTRNYLSWDESATKGSKSQLPLS